MQSKGNEIMENNFIFKNFLYIPDFCNNLQYVSASTGSDGEEITFSKRKNLIKKQ